jgi:hypothetical protein
VAVHSREALIILVVVLLALAGSQLPLLVRMITTRPKPSSDEADNDGSAAEVVDLETRRQLVKAHQRPERETPPPQGRTEAGP